MSLGDRVTQWILNLAGSQGICPKCDEKEVEKRGDLLQCRKCGYQATASAWMSYSPERSIENGVVGSPPRGTEIRKKALSSGGTAFEIPSSGKSGGLLIFSICWLAFTSFFVVVVVSGFLQGDPEGLWGKVFLSLFLSLFTGVGLAMLAFAFLLKYSEALLLVEGGRVVLTKRFRKWIRTRSVEEASVEKVSLQSFYESNDVPQYGIQIDHVEGKPLKFGVSLENDEKGWLLAELKALLGLEKQSSEVSSEVGDVEDNFELILPAKKPAALSGLLIGLFVGAIFLAVGITLMKEAGVFRIVWLLIASVLFSGCLYGLCFRNSRRRKETVVRADTHQVELLKRRLDGEVVSRQTVDRLELDRVEYHCVGATNGEPRYAASLVAVGKALTLFRFRGEEDTKPFIFALRAKLGLSQQNLK